jgi:hypothetical protein
VTVLDELVAQGVEGVPAGLVHRENVSGHGRVVGCLPRVGIGCHPRPLSLAG